MNTKLKAIIGALGLGLAIVSGSAAAVTLYSPLTSFQDDNVDFVIQGTNTGNNPALLDVGDTLISVFEISETFDTFGVDSTPIAPQELSGIAAISLLAFADVDGVGGANDMVFGAYAPGLNSLLPGSVTGVTGGGAGGGAIAAMWLDNSPDLITTGSTNCASRADCILRATDGSLFEVDGFDGDGDEFWVALNANGNLAAVLAGPSGSAFGAVNFGLSILDDGPNTYGDQACVGPVAGLCAAAGLPGFGLQDGRVDVIGQGSVLGGQGLSGTLVTVDGAVAHSDFDFQKAPIPEPATLALLGLGLLGMGTMLRKKVR